MKKFLFFFILFLNAGIAYGETYVSKENAAYTVDYVIPDAPSLSVEECQKYSRQQPDHVIKCRSLLTTHFYLRGDIVDSRMDEIAKENTLRKIQEQRQSEKNEKENAIFGLILFSVIAIFLIIGIIGIVKGYKEEAIFFYSWGDFYGTILYAVAMGGGIAAIISGIGDAATKSSPWWIAPAGFGVFILGCYLNARVPYKYSHNKFIAFCIFVGRLWTMFLMVFLLAGWGAPSKSKDESDAQYAMRAATHLAMWTAMIAWFTKLASKLVNGKRLLENRRFIQGSVKVGSELV